MALNKLSCADVR